MSPLVIHDAVSWPLGAAPLSPFGFELLPDSHEEFNWPWGKAGVVISPEECTERIPDDFLARRRTVYPLATWKIRYKIGAKMDITS